MVLEEALLGSSKILFEIQAGENNLQIHGKWEFFEDDWVEGRAGEVAELKAVGNVELAVHVLFALAGLSKMTETTVDVHLVALDHVLFSLNSDKGLCHFSCPSGSALHVPPLYICLSISVLVELNPSLYVLVAVSNLHSL